MSVLLQGSKTYIDGDLRPADILLEENNDTVILKEIAEPGSVAPEGHKVIDLAGKYVLPGLADVHVHLREPGFSYKETIETGTRASARGGFTLVGAMPNLDPVPDNLEELERQIEAYAKDGVIDVVPYATLTTGGTGTGDLVDYEALAPYVIAFSDDGFGVADEDVMREVMKGVKAAGGIIAQHTEDLEISGDGYINDGPYAAKHGHVGKPGEAEWSQIKRDIDLVRETGCEYHVCHVSTAESVDLIRKAKAEGLPVTAETAPHYLVLTEDDIEEHGRFRMNPPLRTASDREALIEGLLDGTIDFVATDHAPHSDEEKDVPLVDAQNGVVGIEVSAPVIYTYFVKNGKMTFSDFMRVMNTAGRDRFNLPGGALEVGMPADLTVFDPEYKAKVDPADFESMGKSTPFEGHDLYGKFDLTIADGFVAWDPQGLFAGDTLAEASLVENPPAGSPATENTPAGTQTTESGE